MDEVPFVVKTFTASNIHQSYSIAKEFICNALAPQFDLSVPEACLIDLHDENFVSTLNDDLVSVLNAKYHGATFASTLLDASLVNENLKTTSFNMFDRATLFAFDCLILNTDRGGYHNKPNLLIDDDGFFLIDHELTLYILDSPNITAFETLLKVFDANSWQPFYQKHLFYNILKAYKGSKLTLFDAFEESLRTLDINYIEKFIGNLVDNGIEVGASDLLVTYLRTLKHNARKFRNILLGLIS